MAKKIRASPVTSERGMRTMLGDGPALQVGVDKVVEVAVEDPIHVGGLLSGAQVFDELVGVEDVGADLGPEPHLRLLPALRGDLTLSLLALELEEASPQDPHCYLAVLVLAPLVLALHHDAGREVRDPDRRVGLVDVLTARPRGPVGVYLEILLVDLDLDCVVYDRSDRDRGEARVPPAPSVERAYADQPMDPPLRREEAERVLPADAEGGALYTGLLALGVLDDLEPEAPALGPASVHPGEHLGPILGVHAPLARVYGEDGVALVVLPGEEPCHLLFLEHPLDPPQLLLDLREEISVFVGELEQLPGVGEAPAQALQKLDASLDPREAGRDLLGLLRIIPEARAAHPLAELRSLAPQALNVEERLQFREAFLQLRG